MAYTATKYLTPKPYAFPRGQENTQHLVTVRGQLLENDTATEYSVGGLGSSSFEVTAFSAVGLVTYSALKGQALVNGQRVVIYNTSSNTNDGTYVVSALTSTTFVAQPIGLNALAGSAQTTQTAEGVGQIQWGNRTLLPQTFTATAVTVSGGVMTVTYTTLTGPQLAPGQSLTIAGMTNAGNNGTFSVVQVATTSSTAGSFTVLNASAVASDSGTGTANLLPGIDIGSVGEAAPVQVLAFSTKGGVYVWDATNYTFRLFTTGSASGDILNESALGASTAFDNTITFEAIFVR